MFRSDAGLGMRIARTVLLPSGPLIVVIVLVSARAFPDGDPLAKVLVLVAFAWFFCSLVLVPALLFKDDSSPGSSTDEDSDGGGGSGGPPGPPARGPGPGGIPLPDAEQSRERVRDHVRRKRQWLGRRTAREPEQTPSHR